MQMRKTIARTDPPPAADPPGPFAVGSYLVDGTALLGVVGELPQEPSLRLVEDCSTLEITVVSIDDLRARGAQPVAR